MILCVNLRGHCTQLPGTLLDPRTSAIDDTSGRTPMYSLFGTRYSSPSRCIHCLDLPCLRMLVSLSGKMLGEDDGLLRRLEIRTDTTESFPVRVIARKIAMRLFPLP